MASPKDMVPPDHGAILKAIEVAGNNIEILKQLRSYQDKFAHNSDSLEEYFETISRPIGDATAMAEFVHSENKGLESKIWDGMPSEDLKMLHPDYLNFQDFLAKKQRQELSSKFVEENMQNVVMVYDVSEDSEFVRAYLVNERQLDEKKPEDKKIIDLYDQYFHSWLVANKMSIQDGVIFDVTKLDRKANYTQKVNSEDVIRLLESSNEGLKTTLRQKHELNLEVVRNQPSTPTQEPTAAGV